MIDNGCGIHEFDKGMRKCKASINDSNRNGVTPLMAAARAGNVELVDHICRNFPLIVNLGDLSGKTAVYYAAQHNQQRKAIQILSRLVAKGADVNISCNDPLIPTALTVAKHHKLFLVATHLKSLGAVGDLPESEKRRIVPPNLFLSDDDDDNEIKFEKRPPGYWLNLADSLHDPSDEEESDATQELPRTDSQLNQPMTPEPDRCTTKENRDHDSNKRKRTE